MDSKRKTKRKAADNKEVIVEKAESRLQIAEVPSDYESDEVNFYFSMCSQCLQFENMF